MANAACGPSLADELLYDFLLLGATVVQDLDGDRLVAGDVAAEVDHSRPALADDALDLAIPDPHADAGSGLGRQATRAIEYWRVSHTYFVAWQPVFEE